MRGIGSGELALSIQQEQDESYPDDATKYDGISSFAKADTLHETVDDGETWGEVVDASLHAFQIIALTYQMLFGFDCYANLILDQSVRTIWHQTMVSQISYLNMDKDYLLRCSFSFKYSSVFLLRPESFL